ncbi:MAG: cysteine synthase family protein [Bacteroidetes bacterium]|nr:cysteine synthase family protein [Bacteroidota bacterium]
MRCNSILDTIGNTPLIKLNRITEGIPATVYAKVESFNPGQSAKDRIALYMVEKAEKEGRLHPGDTIVEATSGNTGLALAIVCRVKGYKCVLTVSSKSSSEKIRLLKSMGADVIVCPANVDSEDPRSYYSKAEQLHREIPNSFYLNQNYSHGNSEAHYATTGPEIWEQTEGKITHYVCCAGTGGTLSGTSKYLKEMNPNIRVIGVDAFGSVLKKYWMTGEFDEHEIYPYRVEGLGKAIIPANVYFDLIDEFVKVTDRSSAFRTRELASMEGILAGYSSGSVIQAILKIKNELKPHHTVVGLLPDHGSRYLGKVFNDEWMKEQGFIREENKDLAFTKMYKRYKRKYRYYINKTLSHKH